MPSPTTYSQAVVSSLTGDIAIDSLINGTQWFSHTITFSFPTASSYWSTNSSGYGLSSGIAEPWVTGYAALSASDMQATRQALNSWANVANLNFVEVVDDANTVGDIRFAYASGAALNMNAQAWAYSPTSAECGGDVWFDSGGTSFTSLWTLGSYEYATAVHEIGHAIGLKHPFASSQYNSLILDPAFDSRTLTTMSYTTIANDLAAAWYSYDPTTPMVLDIAAVQALYGANWNYNSTNTTYSFNDNGGRYYFETIWDGGGIDTIIVSGTTGATINLNQVQGSYIGNPVYACDLNGNNLYTVRNVWIASGVVIENATGGNGADTITGNSVANILNGGIGIDTMIGGAGNDTYVIDHLQDAVIELLNDGIDLVKSSVTFSLATCSNTENITLIGASAINGTGNALNNTLTGNSAANILNGGLGNDTMIGSTGNDTYVVNVLTDVVTELAGAGTDTVQSSVTYSLVDTDGTGVNGGNVENLTLTGAVAINGTGNALNNTLTGNSAANILNGGLGNDTMIGGLGNDTYVVNVLTDVVTELVGAGTDTVQASVTYNLFDTDGTGANGGNVENLILTGAAIINGTGNALANTLTGNGVANTLNGQGGNDILLGGAGKDTLIGGTGLDKFDFNAIAESVLGLNRDLIKDFTRAQGDKVDLSTIDAKTAAGLANDAFTFITGATFTAAGQVRYANGVIYGNTDADAQAEFEIGITLVGTTSMLASDFIL